MRCGKDPRSALCLALVFQLASISPGAAPLTLVHEQRYSMGTMFDILVYHASPAEATRAIDRALTEIVRLDEVLSHYKPDSHLSKLHRDGASGFVAVEPSLFEVIEESLWFSRQSGGRFDVTIGPLVKAWRAAGAEGRRPSEAEISNAIKCVGFEKIETIAPDRIRFRAGCVQLDLGGIGKGYAVDRAIAMLRSDAIEHALVNAGGSSIGSLGAPPGQEGWPVALGTSDVLLLRDTSMSTSQQHGEIVDPRTRSPIDTRMSVSVVTRRGSAADALSTTLLLVPIEEGMKLLERFPDAAAIWRSPDGGVVAAYGESRLRRPTSP
jgi:thiamine biosynthesis lipoprotein